MKGIVMKLNKHLLRKYELMIAVLVFCFIFFIGIARADAIIGGEYPTMWLKSEDGDLLLSCEYIYETHLSFVYSDSSKRWGFVDKQSGYLQSAIYDEVYDLFCIDSNLPILVEMDGKIGYLDRKNGDVVIPFYYKYFWYYSEFCNGYAVVLLPENDEENFQTVLINTEGHEIHFEYGLNPASFVYDDVIIVMKTYENVGITKRGLGTTSGDILIYPKYDYIADFYEGYACIKQSGRWGHIDIQGHEIVPPTYKLLEEICGSEGYYFENGMAVLLLEDETTLFIDYNGNEISPNGKELPEWYLNYEGINSSD